MALPLPAQDAELVTLARRGREDAFGALYERYFDGVYDFLTRLLRDRQEAADVAQDTFIKAFERLGHLEKPESFKSWLFTIAHRSGLNRIERSKRAVAVGDFYVSDREAADLGVIDPDRAGDPERSAEARAAASIIWEAAAGLDPRTYSVMDLHVRQGLDSAEIAEVLGVSKGNAYTMVSRMKKSFSATLSTYLLVRSGSADCAVLGAIVAAEEATGLTPELRRSVDRHAKTCEVCEENRKVLFIPLKMFAALAAAPIPPGLKATIWGSIKAAGIGGGTAAVKGTAGTEASSGLNAAAGVDSTRPAATAAGGGALRWMRSNAGGFAAAAVLIALLFVGGAALLNNDGGDGDTEVLSAGVTTTALPASATTAPESTTTVTTTAAPTSTTPPTTLGSSSETTTTRATTTIPPTTTSPPTTVPPPTFVARNDEATLAEDTSIIVNVLANDSGYASGLAPQISTSPSHGEARVAGSEIFYAPAADYAGTDSLAYSIRAKDGSSKSAQVTFTITGVNDVPTVPGPGKLSVQEDVPVSFDPFAGAVDVDGDVLEMTRYDQTSEHGGSLSDGSLVYSPAPNWSGDDTFTYTVSDGTVEVVVSVAVVVDPVNDVPAGPVPALQVAEGETGVGNVLEGWSDVEGDRIFVVNTGTNPTDQGGTVALGSAGWVTYTPPAQFAGFDGFVVVISDGTDTTTVDAVVTVGVVNSPPVVANRSFRVPEDLAVGATIGVVTATDPDGDDFEFEPNINTVFTIRPDGTLVLTEALDFEADNRHRLDASVIDEHGAATDFTVRLNVTDVDEAPSVAAATFRVSPGDPAGTTAGRIHGSDPEGAAVTYSLRGGGGLIVIDAGSGVVSLAKAADPADYPIDATAVVADPAGNTGTARVTVLIDDADGPVITDFSSEVDAFYEPPPEGGVCPSRPRSTLFTATVTDPSGVRGADLRWRIEVDGVVTTGGAKMSLVDDRYQVNFSIPRGLLTDRNAHQLFAKVRARDDFNNFSESAEISVTVLPCNFD